MTADRAPVPSHTTRIRHRPLRRAPAWTAAIVAAVLVLVAACGSSEQTARYDRAAFCAALTWLGVGGVAMTPDETLALVRQLAASGPPELATELRALAQYQEARLPSAEELRENEPALTDERRVELQQELEALEAAFRPTLDQLLPRLEAECTGFVEPSPTQAPVRLEASQRSVSTLADGTTVRFVETVDPDGTEHLCILVDEPESISGMYPVDVERCSSSEDPMLAGSEGDVLRATPRRGLALPDGLVHPVFVVRLPAGHPQPVTVRDASGATWPSATTTSGLLYILDAGSGATGLREALEVVGPDGQVVARVEPFGS